MVIGKQYAVTGSAVALTDANILNLVNTSGSYAKYLIIKNAAGAANVAYIGPSTVTAVPANAYYELSAGKDYILEDGSGGHGIKLNDLYVIGTANAANLLFITVIM